MDDTEETTVEVTLDARDQVRWRHGLPKEICFKVDAEGISYHRYVYPPRIHPPDAYSVIDLYMVHQRLLLYGVPALASKEEYEVRIQRSVDPWSEIYDLRAIAILFGEVCDECVRVRKAQVRAQAPLDESCTKVGTKALKIRPLTQTYRTTLFHLLNRIARGWTCEELGKALTDKMRAELPTSQELIARFEAIRWPNGRPPIPRPNKPRKVMGTFGTPEQASRSHAYQIPAAMRPKPKPKVPH